MIVIITEFIVSGPDIVYTPIVKRRTAPYVLKGFGYPTHSVIAVLFIYNTAVPLEGFRSSYSEKTYGFSASVYIPVPPSELLCKAFLMHFIFIVIKRIIVKIYNIRLIRHFPDPYVPFIIVPRIPVHFIAAESGSGRHRKTYPVRLDKIQVFFKGFGNILSSI